MKAPERDLRILSHIVSYCGQIEMAVEQFGRDYAVFSSNPVYRNAVALCILQIGELVNSLSDNFKSLHHEMPWHQIVAFRNIVSHDYGKVDHAIMWTTITEDIPALKAFCSEQLS